MQDNTVGDNAVSSVKVQRRTSTVETTATAQAQAAATARAERTIRLQIHGNLEWQDTGVDLQEGQWVQVQANGAWVMFAGIECSANGESNHPFNYFGVQLPIGALIGRVGSGTPFHVGAHLRWNTQHSGRLYLRPNDNDLSDNSGSLRVQVYVEPLG